MKLKIHISSLLFTILCLAGCASFNSGLVSKSQQAEPTRTQQLLKAGAEYLQKDEIDKAQAVFNTGLKFDLNNAALHFLNAFTYQLKYEKGDMDSFAAAEAGYKTAIGLDSTLDIAYLQLGKLYMSSTNYTGAKKVFALAVDSKPKSPFEALFGLAQSSMLSGDLKTAIFATNKLDDLNWQDPRLFRVKALLAAIAKQPKQAAEMLDRLLAIKTIYISDEKSESKSRDIIVAQAKTEEPTEKSNDSEGDKKAAAAAPSEERKNWFRCDPRPFPVLEKDITPLLSNGSSLPVNEENATSVPLPAPCVGEKPPSAMIEVTMIRTEETIQKSYGINLMDGLSLGRSITQGADGSITRTSKK